MAESRSNDIETAHCIESTIKKTIEKIIDEIEFENMQKELSVFDDYKEDVTAGDIAVLLNYAKKFTGSDEASIIGQPEEVP